MVNMELNKTVREVVLEIPGATRLFEKLGIDYCCGGEHSLEEACAQANVELNDVLSVLAQTTHDENRNENFLDAKLAYVIDHIVSTHHVFTREEIDRLQALLLKVCTKHGQNHPELEQLQTLFQSLSSELRPHMMKEELVLFPYIVAMEEAAASKRTLGVPPFGAVTNPVRMMMAEHENAGELLKQMRQITSSYSTPPDACISYETLYRALDAFEKDLHQHIHLENNILFPRAVIMEANPQIVSV